MTTKKEISQGPAKNTSTTRTKQKAVRPAPPAKPAPRPVKAQFKAGKDI